MSQDAFKTEFATLVAASVPVIAVRTREPLRVESAIREFAFIKQGDLFTWNRVAGTYKFPADDFESVGELSSDETVGSALAALQLVGETANDGTRRQFWTLMYPHWEVPDMPPMIQYLVNFSKAFASDSVRKTLAMIVPENFTLPIELSDCVVVVDFTVPDIEELSQVVISLFSTYEEARRPRLSDEDIEVLARAMAGMTLQSAEDALARVLARRSKLFPEIDIADFQKGISVIKAEIVKKSEVLEVMQPVDMSLVGGLENLKEYIKQRVSAFTQEARDFGVDRPRGIALIGPPGTGKTLGAKAVASELKWPLVRFDISRVFDGLVGGSEKKTAAALKMIKAMSPCVVLLDEVDKAFNMNSGGGDSGVGMRVLGMILTDLQESRDEVYWIMTANRTEGLPPELLRKGRLDEVFSVTVPNPTERRAVLSIHLSIRKQDPASIAGLDAAVSGSDGFVPAEIESAVSEAVTQAFEHKVKVTGALIVEQFGKMRKLSEAFAAQFTAMAEWAENNARPASAEPRPTRTRSRAAVVRPTPGSQARTIGNADDDTV